MSSREWCCLAIGCLLAGPLGAGESLPMPARTATEYALTTSASWEHPYPSDWRLLASNDRGRSWVVLDVRRGQIFRTRGERRVFALTNSVPFNAFRLEVESVEPDVELADFELRGPIAGVTNGAAEPEMKITCSSEHALLGPAEQAFDHDPSTKWLGFGSAPGQTAWIQCQYTAQREATELVNVSECIVAGRRMAARNPLLDQAGEILSALDANAGKPLRTLAGYALTSANDFPGRDPRDWRLLGSNDRGQTWQTLDLRRNESFATRFQRRVFELTNQTACAWYRLQIDSVRGPFSGPDPVSCLQLAECEPLYAGKGEGTCGIAIQARGDNPPIETVEMAFDGDSKTKWLDFGGAGNTNKATWVQWQYFAAPGSPVIDVRRLRAAQARPPRPIRLALQGVVATWHPASRTLGFLDQTGFQLFRLGSPVERLKPGLRLRLGGIVRFEAGLPVVPEPEIELLEELPVLAEVRGGQSVDKDVDFRFGVGEGKVASVLADAHGLTIALAQEREAGRLVARMIGMKEEQWPYPRGSTVRVEGVVEPVYNGRGQRVVGILWIADREHATRVAPKEAGDKTPAAAKTEADISAEPSANAGIFRIRELKERDLSKSIPVTVRGVITYIDLSFDYFYVQEGADGILVGNQLDAGLAPFLQQEGSYVEVKAVTATNHSGLVATSFAKVLGRGELPDPLHHTLDYLMTGRDDGQWVQVEGVVNACEEHRLTLSVLGGRLMVWINEFDKASWNRLVGCLVRVNGVCSPLTTTRNMRMGVRLLAPTAACIEVVARPPEDPFSLRSQPIGQLLQPESRRATAPTALVKTSGVVTHREPLMLFVQGGTEGVRVLLRQEGTGELGDRVEVVGFAEPDGFSARLVQALVRRVGPASLPPAQPIDLRGNDLSNQDAARCQIDALYLGRSTKGPMQALELQDTKEQRTFSAFFPTEGGVLPAIPVGSRVRVQGVLKVDADTLPDYGKILASFQLYANSPRDLTLLAQPTWWTLRRTLWGLAGASAAALICLAWVALLHRQVARQTLELRIEIGERRRTAANLEAEIAERKRMEAQVEKTHQDLLDASRRAGMAEVASSVLHNVGNVLNSINVSAGLIASKLRQSKTANLAKAAELLRAHESNLGEFLSHDLKGRHLPKYLDQLAERLLAEQASALEEIALLTQNVEHVKEIVAMQQNYANVLGVMERASPVELVEDALRIPADSLARHAIQVVRQFDPDLPTITVDKHKIIQVLVNLLQNAKHACQESGKQDQRITVQLARQDRRLRISVADNGVGIPPENLTRIFSHGFTTRKDGHGFGLHSSALAAKEMGGAVIAHSDGCGQGATFTLELPLPEETLPSRDSARLAVETRQA